MVDLRAHDNTTLLPIMSRNNIAVRAGILKSSGDGTNGRSANQLSTSNPTQYESPICGSVQNNPMNAAFTGETDDVAVNTLDRVLLLVNCTFNCSFDEQERRR